MQKNKKNINDKKQLSSFIKAYPDQQLHQNLQILQQQFKYYRAINGDGNCFYRAFAYLYLVTQPLINYNQTFPKIQWVCRSSTISSTKQFQQQLKEFWNRYIKQLAKLEKQQNKQNKIQLLFNQFAHFDELIIGYFRSVNYQYLKQNQNKFIKYFPKNASYDEFLNKVATFKQESVELEVSSLAEAMKTRITLICITKQGLDTHIYMDDQTNKSLFLFYRPGHYDIIYNSVKTSSKGPKPPQKQPIHSQKLKQNKKEPQVQEYDTQNKKTQPNIKQEKKNSFFTTPDLKNFSSKYDMKYCQLSNKSKNQRESQKEQNREESIPRGKIEMISLSTWSQKLQRCWLQLLGIMIIVLIGYMYIPRN